MSHPQRIAATFAELQAKGRKALIPYVTAGFPFADITPALMLGMVDVKWSIEEYSATFVEDDTKFVGTISQTGFFTPNMEGPNPERSGNRNNIGDVYVVADYTPAGGTALRGRAHLLVTAPLYMDWSSTEVGR